jgi:hypothetical protein
MLDRAALALTGVVRAALMKSPPPAVTGEIGRLEGALTDALRRPGGAR